MTVTLLLCEGCGKRPTKCKCGRHRLVNGRYEKPAHSPQELYSPKEVEAAVLAALDQVSLMAPSVKSVCAEVAKNPLPEKSSSDRRARPRSRNVSVEKAHGQVFA